MNENKFYVKFELMLIYNLFTFIYALCNFNVHILYVSCMWEFFTNIRNCWNPSFSIKWTAYKIPVPASLKFFFLSLQSSKCIYKRSIWIVYHSTKLTIFSEHWLWKQSYSGICLWGKEQENISQTILNTLKLMLIIFCLSDV